MQMENHYDAAKYKKVLKNYHKVSDRHVLVLETDLSYQEKCRVFHYSDLLRKAGNELVAIMKNKYEQLIRTKKYRKLKLLYAKYAKSNDKAKCKEIAKEMSNMQKQYDVTWNFCRSSMIPIGKKYGLDAVFALTKAEDVWKAVEKCLYSDGTKMHFAKRGHLPNIRAKQKNRGIIIKSEEEKLFFKFNGIQFSVKVKDRFERDEISAILAYLSNPEWTDFTAVKTWQEDGVCMDTYRPCYASLVCKKIRGKCRVYLHITVEGKAKPKYDRQGNLKHKYRKGKIGCDIGTQTIAYTSDIEVGLKNLAERGSSILDNEQKEKRIYRAMDRSRRATNPNNYNADGTIRKGRKIWNYSNHYRKLKAKHSELCRINAENRHFSINEEVNHLRQLGDTFITESQNAKRLQKRSKITTRNQAGKINRKKRFGKSIKNRCPGYFQAKVKQKFTNTRGIYIEVPNHYRASQYDHTVDDYSKKKLSDRMYCLGNGTRVQRDWYSSFLLYNINMTERVIDKDQCKVTFDMQYQKEKVLIEWIRANKIKVFNSGIKINL